MLAPGTNLRSALSLTTTDVAVYVFRFFCFFPCYILYKSIFLKHTKTDLHEKQMISRLNRDLAQFLKLLTCGRVNDYEFCLIHSSGGTACPN